MKELPLAGTFRLDGMLQGPLPPDVDDELQSWAAEARSQGLHFHLRTEGGSYSLVADPTVRNTSILKGNDLKDSLEDNLQNLLNLLANQGVGNSFSTIRSEEFRPGVAVRTLYAIDQNGSITSEQREAEIETGEAPLEITATSIKRIALPALVALSLLLFISSFFIDYRALFGMAHERLAPLDKSELSIQTKTNGNPLNFELKEVDQKHSALIFHLSHGKDWQETINSKPADITNMDWNELRTVLAIQQGRFRIELFNKKEELISSQEIDISSLHSVDAIDFAVRVHSSERIASVVLKP